MLKITPRACPMGLPLALSKSEVAPISDAMTDSIPSLPNITAEPVISTNEPIHSIFSKVVK